ncbi:MAG: hypothetical protein D6782_00695, partial [Alphaproteobacteria bacterium]
MSDDAAAPAPVAVSQCRFVAVHDEQGRRVVGIEDIVVDHARGIAYLSAYDRRQPLDTTPKMPDRFLGAILAVPIARMDQARIAARTILPSGKSAAAPRPHGLELLIEPDGRRWLFTIDRQYAMPRILTLALTDDGFSAQAHKPPRAAPALCHPNNIAAIDHDRLFVSNDRGACSWLGLAAENMLGLKRSFLAYLHAGAFSVAAGELFFANGLAIDRLGPDRLDLAV